MTIDRQLLITSSSSWFLITSITISMNQDVLEPIYRVRISSEEDSKYHKHHSINNKFMVNLIGKCQMSLTRVLELAILGRMEAAIMFKQRHFLNNLKATSLWVRNSQLHTWLYKEIIFSSSRGSQSLAIMVWCLQELETAWMISWLKAKRWYMPLLRERSPSKQCEVLWLISKEAIIPLQETICMHL